MNTKFIISIAFSVVTLLICQSVIANDFSGDPGKRNSLTLGLAMLYKDKPYKDYDSSEKKQGVPVILYEGENFFARGSTFGWDFLGSDTFELSIIGKSMGDSYDESDSDVFIGNGDRDASFGLGGQVVWRPEKLGFSLSAITDVTDNSEGTQVIGEVFYTHKEGSWVVRPSAIVTWQPKSLHSLTSVTQ